jgi:hypothetical protein
VNPRLLGTKPRSRARLALWLALCILLQSFFAVQHDVAMATGLEVCTAEGAKRVDGQGEQLDGQPLLHACCVMADLDLAMPPPRADVRVVFVASVPPAEALPTAWVCAQWVSPLSRGPPSLV